MTANLRWSVSGMRREKNKWPPSFYIHHSGDTVADTGVGGMARGELMTNDERTTWRCPYCNQFATLDHNKDVYASERDLFDDTDEGHVALMLWGVRCPNHECLKLSLNAGLWTAKGHYQNLELNELVQSWNLRPQSSAKPQPEYIPEPLREDYNEACLILDLSPKVAATLARRCLQGMIRDFWSITMGRLIDEIAALEEHVEAEVWEAIKAVKDVGNIGAHMEKDINLIIEVDPEEANLLIQLIEQLFDEWYVARHEREERMKRIVALAEDKADLRKQGKAKEPPTEPDDAPAESNTDSPKDTG